LESRSGYVDKSPPLGEIVKLKIWSTASLDVSEFLDNVRQVSSVKPSRSCIQIENKGSICSNIQINSRLEKRREKEKGKEKTTGA